MEFGNYFSRILAEFSRVFSRVLAEFDCNFFIFNHLQNENLANFSQF